MLDAALHLAGFVVRLINDSPRVEGNNITVDIDTDHPVQCGIRLAAMASPLRDCESIQKPFILTCTQYSFVYELVTLIISNIQFYCCTRYCSQLAQSTPVVLLYLWQV